MELAAIIGRASLLADPTSARDAIFSEAGALLLIDKEYGITSFSVVNTIRRAISIEAGIRKIKCGHAGTLDPLASGLLILATRGKTKALADLIGLDKSYFLRVRFGVTSASFDLEQPIEITGGEELLTEPQVRSAIEALAGEHDQIPPMHSAIKQKGKPVYHRARKGEQIELAARRIMVHDITINDISLPHASFTAHVSKGTYIRALARDLGATLNTGAVVTDLRRESIAGWSVNDALTVQEILSLIQDPTIQNFNVQNSHIQN